MKPLANRLVEFRRHLVERRGVLRPGPIDLDLRLDLDRVDGVLAEDRVGDEHSERRQRHAGVSCSFLHRSASSAILR